MTFFFHFSHHAPYLFTVYGTLNIYFCMLDFIIFFLLDALLFDHGLLVWLFLIHSTCVSLSFLNVELVSSQTLSACNLCMQCFISVISFLLLLSDFKWILHCSYSWFLISIFVFSILQFGDFPVFSSLYWRKLKENFIRFIGVFITVETSSGHNS